MGISKTIHISFIHFEFHCIIFPKKIWETTLIAHFHNCKAGGNAMVEVCVSAFQGRTVKWKFWPFYSSKVKFVSCISPLMHIPMGLHNRIKYTFFSCNKADAMPDSQYSATQLYWDKHKSNWRVFTLALQCVSSFSCWSPSEQAVTQFHFCSSE